MIYTHTHAFPDKKLRCLVIDDESIAIKGIANYINKIDFLNLVATASSATEAEEVLKENPIDLMFLDISMPNKTGLEFLESLSEAPLTILTTAYSEFALDGFRLHVVDYLMKPISFQLFYEACLKAKEIFLARIYPSHPTPKEEETDMYIRQGDSFEKINYNEIIYVEGMQNYLKLHFFDRKLIIHQTMTSLEDLLPQNRFYRIHRSYLINISHIHQITGGQVIMKNLDKLPIAKPRRQELLDAVVLKNLISK